MAYRTHRPRVTVPTHVQPTVPGQPPRPKPKKKYPAPAGYIGGWLQNPNLNANKFKTVKTGKGYYIAKKLKTPPVVPGTPTPPAAPKPPKPPPGPYDAYPSWAKTALTQMASDTAQRQAYGLDIQKWLTGALAPIQASGQAATQNYRSSIAGLPNAGNMAIPQVAAMSPGGTTAASPEAWKANAAQAAASGYSTIQQGQSAIQSFLADSNLGNINQALQTNYAQDLLKIGESAKKEKQDYISKLDEFIATSTATAEQHAQDVARQSTNDWYDFVAQLTNSGVKLNAQQMKQLAPPTGSGGVKVVSQTMPTNPAYDWVEESPGVWRGTKLPTTPTTKPAKPTGLVGPIEGNQKPPKGYVAVQSGGKTYWRALGKTGTGSGSGALTAPQKRLQFTTSKEFWVGKPNTSVVGGADKPGLNKAVVNGFTNPDGSLGLNHRDSKSAAYVFYVRAFRLREQVGAMTDDNARTDTILKGVLGSRNFSRFEKWRNDTANRGPMSFYAAKKARHV